MIRRNDLGIITVSLLLAVLWLAGCGKTGGKDNPDGGPDTDTSESCAENNPCGEHGTCDDTSGVVQCDCEDGWGSDFCDECAPGWHADGAECVLDETCLPNSCAGHGTCDDSTGVVICDCDTGYTGDFCDACDADYHLNNEGNCDADENCETASCNSHGTCDDTTGVVVCDCEDGWEGQYCTACAPGFHPGSEAADGGVDAGADGGAGDETCVLDETCMPTSCDGHGTCEDETGEVVCDCDANYTGQFCTDCDEGFHWESNTCVTDTDCPSPAEACSGHGTCDDSTGVPVCTCSAAYDGSDICDECAPGYHDDDISVDVLDCVADTTCLVETCDGHGICDDSGDIVVCACDPGYLPPFCHSCDDGHHMVVDTCVDNTTCIISLDPDVDTCHTHGTCDDLLGVAICSCDPGWTGPSCSTCVAGYHDDAGACVLDETCLPGSCAYNGDCADDTGVVVCACDPGYDIATYCAECADNFHYVVATDACVADESCPTTGECSSHGTCVDTTGEAICTCDDGYDGETCNLCAAGYHDDAGDCVLDEQCMPNSCSGATHGSCNDSTGEVVCSCIAASGYTGTYCNQCLTGFHAVGTDCVADEVCDAEPHTTTCSGNGDCAVVGGVIECTCDYGWDGDTCNTCDPGFHVDGLSCVLDESCLAGEASCSYRGTCTVSSGHVACNCDDPNMNDAAYCASCNGGYHLVGSACVADEVCDAEPHTTTCSGNGDCSVVGGEVVCACDVGWDGDTCATCAPGYHDVAGNCELQESCLAGEASCAYHGTCIDTTGYVVCTCDPGYDAADYCADCAFGYHWFGGACVVNEDCLPSPCGANGDCSVVGGEEVCSCDAGYAGDTCNTCAPGFQDNDANLTCLVDCDLGTLTCNHGGVCADTDGTAGCACTSGWSGTECGTCVDDSYENDDSDGYAHHLVGDSSTTGLVICGEDQDWYSINLPVGGVLDVDVTFTNANGDIDIALWYPSEGPPANRVAYSESTDDDESFSYTVPAGAAGRYYIQIKGYMLDRNTYNLTVLRTGTCDTCASLGMECGTWDTSCGPLTCGPCGVGIECDEYFGVCAETLCDLTPGCCVGNTLWYCDGGDEYSETCGSGYICTWSDADFWFACYDTPGTPPAGMIEECPTFP